MNTSNSKPKAQSTKEDSLDCNIGPREQRKRRLMGIVALACGTGLSFLTVVSEAPRWARLIVFIPIWIAGLGLLQARDRTCISLAARGARNMDSGEEQIPDRDLVAQLRAKAGRINRRSLIVAAVLTLVVLFFPGT